MMTTTPKSSEQFVKQFPAPQLVRSELLRTTKLLQERQLHHSAKWAAELALALDHAKAPVGKSNTSSTTSDEELEGDGGAQFAMASSLFGLREYRRCAHLLQKPRSSRAAFLYSYSLYMAGEEGRDKESAEGGGLSALNKELLSLDVFLSAQLRIPSSTSGTPLNISSTFSESDGPLLYLAGVIARDLEQIPRAVKLLVHAVSVCPCIFSAWQELTGLVTSMEEVHSLGLPDHWMCNVFSANVLLETQDNARALALLNTLSNLFPQSSYFIAQRALAHYNMREFDLAEPLFEQLVSKDPHRLENLESYSNILYVKEDRLRLAHLAHSTQQYHPYRAETCCIVGNYYSMKGEHEKATVYFQRALKLNRHLLAAWTLLGHEYLELKNPSAAVASYRTAVDENPREYRAWYGLGQVYELLKMPHYAVHYYRKATSLRPYDARMWCAVANCYELVNKIREAIKCYERAEANVDREGIAVARLAALHQSLNELDKAAHYYRKNLDRHDAESDQSQATVDALLFLANYAKLRKDFNTAYEYCNRLLDFPGKEKEEAKALLREMHSIQHQQAMDSP